MTKTLETSFELQVEINRRLWIQALRENGHRQCVGALRRGIGDMVCAYGLAEDVLNTEDHSGVSEALGVARGCPRPYADNDDGWTFTQIADAAEQGRYWPVEAQSVG